MLAAMTTVIDRRLERLVVARVRRRAPVLDLVPTRWIVVVVRPAVRRARQRVLRQTVLAASGAAIALTLAVLLAT